MGQSSQLRLRDVRAVFRLIGQCRELGADATLWRQHMLVELLRLTGGQVAMGGPTGLHDNFASAQPLPVLDVGWDGPRERGIFQQYMRDRMHLRDPAIARFGIQIPHPFLGGAKLLLIPTVVWRSWMRHHNRGCFLHSQAGKKT